MIRQYKVIFDSEDGTKWISVPATYTNAVRAVGGAYTEWLEDKNNDILIPIVKVSTLMIETGTPRTIGVDLIGLSTRICKILDKQGFHVDELQDMYLKADAGRGRSAFENIPGIGIKMSQEIEKELKAGEWI